MDLDKYGIYFDRDQLAMVETGEGRTFAIGVIIFVNKEGKGKRRGVKAEGTIEIVAPLVNVKLTEEIHPETVPIKIGGQQCDIASLFE